MHQKCPHCKKAITNKSFPSHTQKCEQKHAGQLKRHRLTAAERNNKKNTHAKDWGQSLFKEKVSAEKEINEA